MSGEGAIRALRDRFESIRRREVDRLTRKKLRNLTDAERQVVDSVTADVVRAIARIPDRALSEEAGKPAVDALVQLFDL